MYVTCVTAMNRVDTSFVGNGKAVNVLKQCRDFYWLVLFDYIVR